MAHLALFYVLVRIALSGSGSASNLEEEKKTTSRSVRVFGSILEHSRPGTTLELNGPSLSHTRTAFPCHDTRCIHDSSCTRTENGGAKCRTRGCEPTPLFRLVVGQQGRLHSRRQAVKPLSNSLAQAFDLFYSTSVYKENKGM